MTRAGLPVPPGFIVTTEARKAYYANDKNFPAGRPVKPELKVGI